MKLRGSGTFMQALKRTHQIAKEYDLLISGGSDYHGANKPYLHLGTGKGGLLIPDEILIPIKKAAGVL